MPFGKDAHVLGVWLDGLLQQNNCCYSKLGSEIKRSIRAKNGGNKIASHASHSDITTF